MGKKKRRFPESRMFVLKYGPRTERHEDMLNLSRDYRVEGILKRVLSLGLANHYATL